MSSQFDELTKSMAQSVTRRAALKKFGVGLAGMALACLGLANRAEAETTTQCLGTGRICAYGGILPPASCVSNCCAHDARRGFDNHFRIVWYCK
jgi:hypothetical protein